MEEGGGKTEEEIQSRLDTWKTLGRKSYVDLVEFHEGFGYHEKFHYPQYFSERPKLQPTWSKLIRLILTAKTNRFPSTEEIREYQRNHLGRKNGDTFLAELMPLPSPSISDWRYPKWTERTNLPSLQSRDEYEKIYREIRVEKLQKLIQEYMPSIVIFYGISYKESWGEISKTQFEKHVFRKENYFTAKRENTLFVITEQPNGARSNAYWNKVGRYCWGATTQYGAANDSLP